MERSRDGGSTRRLVFVSLPLMLFLITSVFAGGVYGETAVSTAVYVVTPTLQPSETLLPKTTNAPTKPSPSWSWAKPIASTYPITDPVSYTLHLPFITLFDAAASLSFLPLVALQPELTPSPTPTSTPIPTLPPPLPPPTPFTGTTPIDFDAVRADLEQQGYELAFSKIGFHAGPGGNPTGLTEFLYDLDAAGVPFVVKSVDTLTGVYDAQMIMAQSDLPHVTIFRRSVPYDGALPGHNPDLPDYNKSPAAAAQEHWDYHKAGFPLELDPTMTWVETVNEVDKNRSEWLGQFALETAQLALADGYKWAAFGWATGEPEPYHWESPSMLEFLRLVGENPDRLAIAVHEYSLTTDEIGHWYPYLLGRFQALFQVCDEHGIPRPTILITEWGWEAFHVPEPAAALEDMAWASWLYAAYPEVKGAAIWYLGPGFQGIADEAQQLIAPLGEYSVSHYFAVTPGQGQIDPALFYPIPPTNYDDFLEMLESFRKRTDGHVGMPSP